MFVHLEWLVSLEFFLFLILDFGYILRILLVFLVQLVKYLLDSLYNINCNMLYLKRIQKYMSTTLTIPDYLKNSQNLNYYNYLIKFF